MNNKHLFIAAAFTSLITFIPCTAKAIRSCDMADDILMAARSTLNQDLITIFNARDVHSLSQITAENFSYHDYLYWSGSLGWNTYLSYLYWRNYSLYLALTEKSNQYYSQYLADNAFYGNNTTRVYQEAALPYLNTLQNAGIHQFTAYDILPRYELWQYLNQDERYYYINAINDCDKQQEVWALHHHYVKEYQAEQDNEREERERAQQTQEERRDEPYWPTTVQTKTDDTKAELARLAAEEKMVEQLLEINAP